MGASSPAAVKKLAMRILPDAKARANALKTGELDIAVAIEPQDAVSLQAAGFKDTPVDRQGCPTASSSTSTSSRPTTSMCAAR